jgi:hypothetical protein
VLTPPPPPPKPRSQIVTLEADSLHLFAVSYKFAKYLDAFVFSLAVKSVHRGGGFKPNFFPYYPRGVLITFF